MSSNRILLDGAYARGLYVGRARVAYPFSQNGDNNSIIITREWRQREVNYIAGKRGVEIDPKYRNAYLILETEPEPTGIGDVIRVTRTFARIPTQQIEPSSMFVAKPEIAGAAALLGNFADFTSSTYTGFIGFTGEAYTSGTRLFAPSGQYTTQLGTSTLTVPTGGTFTLTYKANTTAALNYNDSGATIATALNGLASVSGESLTFSVTSALTTAGSAYMDLTLTAGTTTTLVTMDGSSLTPAASRTSFSIFFSASIMRIHIGARVALTAHNFNGSNPLIACGGTAPTGLAYLLAATHWSSLDVNNIAFIPFNGSVTWSRFGQSVGSAYVAGTVLTRVKRVTDFYLPGISTGINSVDDIPLPTYQGDDASLLAAIIAGSTSINYEVGELTRWRDSPIFARTITTLNAATL